MTKIINPNAAGIDISSNLHFVAIPEDRCENPVRNFSGFTRDLHELAQWLVDMKIDTVAMESTGSYWYHLYTILLDYSIDVYLVNAQHVKNVPGRKTDVIDAQWLQQLHSNGYLNACFQPDNQTRQLRTYVRLRKQIVQDMARETQHMQKAMVCMNIKLHDVISDIMGKTGRNILEAIIHGERDPKQLVLLKSSRIHSSNEVMIKSLEGNWREEQLFCLQLAYKRYLELEKHLQSVDEQSDSIVRLLADSNVVPCKIKAAPSHKKQPSFNVAQHLYNAYGVNVTEIYGIKQTVALTVLSETGVDIKEKFPTLGQFLSWLNLVPNNKISGGKILSSKMRKRKNRAGQAFREAANSLWRANNSFGDYLRSKKAKSGTGAAVVATAKRIATSFYVMVTRKVEFDPNVIDKSQIPYLKKKAENLTKTLETINLQLDSYKVCEVFVR